MTSEESKLVKWILPIDTYFVKFISFSSPVLPITYHVCADIGSAKERKGR